MQVRPVRSNEVTRLKELRLRALREAPDAFGSRHDDEVMRDESAWAPWVTSGTTFVVDDGDAWHGLSAVFKDGRDQSLCHLVSMWVDPRYRGRGLGSRLLIMCVSRARELDSRCVRLGVVEGNVEATRLYQHAGFQPTGEREPLASNPTKNIVFMALTLRSDLP